MRGRLITKVAVFYRDLPSSLEVFVNADGNMTLRKDGVFQFGEIRAPRATIEIDPVAVAKDKERSRKLLELLEELESNNQILGFSVRV